MITLRSSDGVELEVEETVAMQSQTIRHMIEAGCTVDDNGVSLPNVTSNILAKVIEYCEYCKSQHEFIKSSIYCFSDEHFSQKIFWEMEFVRVDQNTLFDLLLAANYLDIEELLDLMCETVARMMSGKNAEDVRRIFNIKNDYTPEEEAEIHREYQWAFDIPEEEAEVFQPIIPCREWTFDTPSGEWAFDTPEEEAEVHQGNKLATREEEAEIWQENKLSFDVSNSQSIEKKEKMMEERRPEEQGEKEKETIDRINQLPDCLLLSILSHLTLKDKAKTVILSKRWRHLFSSLPHLTFVEDSFCSNSIWPSYWENKANASCWFKTVKLILENRYETLKSCGIRYHYFDQEYKEILNDIFYYICNKDIQNLTFYHSGDDFPVPASLFSCEKLTHLKFHTCNLTVPPKFSGLRHLRSLELLTCDVDDSGLEHLFSCCKYLERLVLKHHFKASKFFINALKLVFLEISLHGPLPILMVRAPCLESVTLRLHHNFAAPWVDNIGESEFSRFISVLKDLGSIQNLSLDLNTTYIMRSTKKGVLVPKILPYDCRLHRLKKLNLRMQFDKVYVYSMMSCLLNSCPVLEELAIGHDDDFHTKKVDKANYWDKQIPQDSLSNRLTIVTLYLKCGNFKYWIRFTKFLLINIRDLKRVIIYYNPKDEEHVVIEESQKELRLLQTAAPNTVVELKPSKFANLYF